MGINLVGNLKSILPFFVRIVAVLSRISLIILLPKLLNIENFNLYSLFANLIMYSSTVSGLGLPVYFIKKYTLGEISSSFYLRFVTPVSILSGVVFFLVSLIFFPSNVEFSFIVILILILIGEIITTEYLRLYQAKSFLKKHVFVSFVKSFTLLVSFLVLNTLFEDKSLFIVLFSWGISNFISIFYISPNFYKILKVKMVEKVFTKSVVMFSLFYFLGYLIDRSALYYDKIFFYQTFDQINLKKLNILILILQTSFNLIESTFLLNIYNKVFNRNFFLSLHLKIKYFFYVICYSASLTIFLIIFYDNFFFEEIFKLFLSITFYYIFSIIAWYSNLQNYSGLSSIKYFIVVSLTACIYICFVIIFLNLEVDIFIFPLLYPLVSSIIQKISKAVYIYNF
jgi:hypothetical protein